MTKTDIYKRVTDKIIADLEEGVRPWIKPWTGPHGAISRPLRSNGQPYNGINVLLLWIEAELKGYSNPMWIRQVTYEVIPRYSGGSPAMVDLATCQKLIKDEIEDYQAHLEGFYGDEAKAKAEKEGLEGIALSNSKVGYIDLITGREYGQMPYSAIRRPEKLISIQAKTARIFYFRRRELDRQNSRVDMSGRMVKILRALAEKYGMDPYGQEAAAVWDSHLRVR